MRRSERPRWVGVPAFAPCWRSVERLSLQSVKCKQPIPPRFDLGAAAMTGMMDAHPIYIGADQARALPSMTFHEGVEYLHATRLPFETLFLDFTRPAPGELPEVAPWASVSVRSPETGDVHTLTITCAGALVGYFEATEQDEDPIITIVPFGRIIELTKEMAPRVAAALDIQHLISREELLQHTTLVVTEQHRSTTVDLSEWEPLGLVTTMKSIPASAEPNRFAGAIRRLVSRDDADRLVNELVVDARTVCSVPDPPSATALYLAVEHVNEATSPMIQSWASAITGQALVAIQALYFLESQNVEIVSSEPSLERRDVKRARKRGWPISSTVRVKQRIRRRSRPDQPGPQRKFTHRFEREGHYNHVTRGAHVRCRECHDGKVKQWRAYIGPEEDPWSWVPDMGVYRSPYRDGYFNAEEVELACASCGGTGVDAERVTPCFRRDPNSDERTCPYGCRREWVPATVVGPEDKPLLLKTRKAA